MAGKRAGEDTSEGPSRRETHRGGQAVADVSGGAQVEGKPVRLLRISDRLLLLGGREWGQWTPRGGVGSLASLFVWSGDPDQSILTVSPIGPLLVAKESPHVRDGRLPRHDLQGFDLLGGGVSPAHDCTISLNNEFRLRQKRLRKR